MDLRARIMNDLKEALRAKNELVRDTLRMVKSDITVREVEKGADLSDDEVQQVLNKALKARSDAARQYDDGERPELAEKERAEAKVIADYLPKKLNEEETAAAVAAIVSELGLEGKKDMGRLMNELKSRYPGTVDGRLASQIASKAL